MSDPFAALLHRISASHAELDALLADRAGYLDRAGLDEPSRALVIGHLGPSQRERLALACELRVTAVAAELRALFPHALAVVARHRPVDDALFEAFLVAAPEAHTRAASFARFLGTLPLPCAWVGDLAALELAVRTALDLRPHFAACAARYRFTTHDGDTARPRENRRLAPIVLHHHLPFADFPAPLSARPPATWPDDLPRRTLTVAAGISPSPPHSILLAELPPDRPLASLLRLGLAALPLES